MDDLEIKIIIWFANWFIEIVSWYKYIITGATLKWSSMILSILVIKIDMHGLI